MQKPNFNIPSLYGFAGGMNIPGAGGLVHFGARFYNPSVGSWTQLDPSGQSQGYLFGRLSSAVTHVPSDKYRVIGLSRQGVNP